MRILPPTLLALLIAGCATPPPPEPEPVEPTESLKLGPPIAVAPQFGNERAKPGCVPTGDTTELQGTIRVLPFGKGTDGAILDDGEQEWIVTYNAKDGVFESFNDFEVLARGRPCDKQFEAISGPHFEVRSLRAIEE